MSKDDNGFEPDGGVFDRGAVSIYGVADPLSPTWSQPDYPLTPLFPYKPAPPMIPKTIALRDPKPDNKLDFIQPLLDMGLELLDACLLYSRCSENIELSKMIVHLAACRSRELGEQIKPMKLLSSIHALAEATQGIAEALFPDEMAKGPEPEPEPDAPPKNWEEWVSKAQAALLASPEVSKYCEGSALLWIIDNISADELLRYDGNFELPDGKRMGKPIVWQRWFERRNGLVPQSRYVCLSDEQQHYHDLLARDLAAPEPALAPESEPALAPESEPALAPEPESESEPEKQRLQRVMSTRARWPRAGWRELSTVTRTKVFEDLWVHPRYPMYPNHVPREDNREPLTDAILQEISAEDLEIFEWCFVSDKLVNWGPVKLWRRWYQLHKDKGEPVPESREELLQEDDQYWNKKCRGWDRKIKEQQQEKQQQDGGAEEGNK